MSNVNKSDLDVLYNAITQWMHEKKLTLDTGSMIAITMQLMTVAQSIATPGNGPYKRKLVLQVLMKLVEELGPCITERNLQCITTLIRTTIPPLIDMSISLVNGNVDLGKDVNVTNCCFR